MFNKRRKAAIKIADAADLSEHSDQDTGVVKRDRSERTNIFGIRQTTEGAAFARQDERVDLALLASTLELVDLNLAAIRAATHYDDRNEVAMIVEQGSINELEVQQLLVNTTENVTGNSHFVISTKPENNDHYIRYETTTAIDNELDSDQVNELRMENEFQKLKSTNPDELESSLLEPQVAIGQKMNNDFRLRKLDAALSEYQRKKESNN